jgi:hypothetical protein
MMTPEEWERDLQARIAADMARAERGLAEMNRQRRQRLWGWAAGGAVLGIIAGQIVQALHP